MHSLAAYRKWSYTEEEINEIDKYLDHKSDFELALNQIKQYEVKYLVKNVITKQTYETPQFLYARIAMTVAENEPDRLLRVKELIEDLANKDLSLPSPNLEYIGTTKGTATSCCLWTTLDTAQSIAANHHIAEIMTLASAGLGNNLRIRSIGDGVRRNQIAHLGKLGYLRASQSLAKSSKQGTRGGALTTYYTCFDPEVFDLIKARNPTTTDEKKVDGIDYAIMYNPFFADKVKNGEDWMLISLKEAPDLEQAFYNKDESVFIKLYNKYFKDTSIVNKQIVKARDVALSFLKQEYETGRHYDLNIYEVNHHTPLKDPIYSSNLCVAPETTLLTTNGHQIISELEDQEVTIWNGFEWSKTTVVKTGTNQKLVKITTNLGTLDCTLYHKWYLKDGSEIRTTDLKIGDQLLPYLHPVHVDGIYAGVETCPQDNFIIDIQDVERYDDTYCVSEPLRHMAVFNGILTGQCIEICLNTKGYEDVMKLYEETSSEYIYVTTELNTLVIYKDPNTLVSTSRGVIKAFNLSVNDLILTPDNNETKIVKVETLNEVALCNIAAINLQRDYTDEEYLRVGKNALRVINWVIKNSDYAFPNVAYTAKKRMFAGVGLTNLAYELARNKLYYSSTAGKVHAYFLAERHYYMLMKGSLELSQEGHGVAEWMHKTLFPEGWSPLSTYNKNVDTIANFTNRYDWDTLIAAVVANGGIANSTLCAHMPCESSSLPLNSTNSLYAIRAGLIAKGDGSNKTVNIPPGWTDLEYYYEIAYDIPHIDLVHMYAIFQKWCDQSISADYYLDFTSDNASNITSDKSMLVAFLQRVKYGTKSKYYTVSKTNKNEDVTIEVGCVGGGCIL